MAFSDIVSQRVNPYKISHDSNITQKRWEEILDIAKRRALADLEDDDESGGEYFQMTKGDTTLARGAVKGTIEAIVSTAKGAEKKRRRDKNAGSSSSPLTAAESIVRGIDELSDRQWRDRRIENSIQEPGIPFDKRPDSPTDRQKGYSDSLVGQILGTLPEHNQQLAPEEDIFPNDSLSNTTATPSPPPATSQTVNSSTASSNTTTRHTPPKRKLVPFVIVYSRPGSRSKSDAPAQTSRPSSPTAAPNKRKNSPKPRRRSASPSLSNTSSSRRARKHRPRCDIIFFSPKYQQFCHTASSGRFIYKPRLSVDRLVMLCTRARMKLKRRRNRSRSRSRIRHEVERIPNSAAVTDGNSSTSSSSFLKRNLKIGRARRGSFTGRMKIK